MPQWHVRCISRLPRVFYLEQQNDDKTPRGNNTKSISSSNDRDLLALNTHGGGHCLGVMRTTQPRTSGTAIEPYLLSNTGRVQAAPLAGSSKLFVHS